MRSSVRVIRGPFRGRAGSIAGTLEDRARRGITKAVVRIAGGAVELLETANLEIEAQLTLWPAGPTAAVDHERLVRVRRATARPRS